MLHSFYNFDYILRLPVKHVNRLLITAIEKEEENKLWNAWLSLYPFMNMKWLEFKPFSEFKDEIKISSYKYSDITDEEIMEEMIHIVVAHEGGE